MLSELYESYRINPKLTVLAEPDGFFAPLLVSMPADWVASDFRIAYVGQETLGWNWSQIGAAEFGYEWSRPDICSLSDFIKIHSSVADLQHGYKLFDFASGHPINRRSPFWRYFRSAKERVSSSSKSVSSVFTNVIRCAVDTESGFTLWSISQQEKAAYLAWQVGLLRQELEILKPSAILFVTGPNYDAYLSAEFGNLHFEALQPFSVRQIARLKSNYLTAPAFRTYHPGYLNRHLGFAPIEAALEEVLSM